MSDQVDSQVANEDKSTSQADLSQQQSGETQPGNLPAGSALADLALKDPEAAEQLRRHYQSKKDRGVDKAVKTAQQVRDDLEAFAKAMDIDLSKVSEFRQKKILDELYEERYGNSGGDPGGDSQPEAQGKASSKDITALKKLYPDLDFNSGDVTQAISGATNQDAAILALSRVKLSQQDKPKASPTMAPQPGGGTPIASDDQEALRTEYQEKLSAIQPGNTRAITQLQIEYRGKGLPI